jgi:serine/threonine protein phosphatase PrpC
VFSGNYITAEPEVKIIPLKKNQKWAILASDGLWDELGLQEVAQTCKSTPIEKLG